MRQELRIHLADDEPAPRRTPAATAVAEPAPRGIGDRLRRQPHYSVNIYSRRYGEGMDEGDNLDGATVRDDFTRSFDAVFFARDLATRPDCVKQFLEARARVLGVPVSEVVPNAAYVCVNDWKGAELPNGRFPILGVVPKPEPRPTPWYVAALLWTKRMLWGA